MIGLISHGLGSNVETGPLSAANRYPTRRRFAMIRGSAVVNGASFAHTAMHAPGFRPQFAEERAKPTNIASAYLLTRRHTSCKGSASSPPTVTAHTIRAS